MKVLSSAGLACLLLGPAGRAAGEVPSSAPPLSAVHANGSQTVRLRTPAAWTVTSEAGSVETTEARGDGLIVRVLRREGELGLDSQHVECMLVRLAGAMDMRPEVNYEYDFVGGDVGGRRALDSAFVVHYDEPIAGQRDWRQRNLTLVGRGESVCVIGYAPLAAWKKSKQTRALLKAVLDSVELRPWR
jgi:hypothetical protein